MLWWMGVGEGDRCWRPTKETYRASICWLPLLNLYQQISPPFYAAWPWLSPLSWKRRKRVPYAGKSLKKERKGTRDYRGKDLLVAEAGRLIEIVDETAGEQASSCYCQNSLHPWLGILFQTLLWVLGLVLGK